MIRVLVVEISQNDVTMKFQQEAAFFFYELTALEFFVINCVGTLSPVHCAFTKICWQAISMVNGDKCWVRYRKMWWKTKPLSHEIFTSFRKNCRFARSFSSIICRLTCLFTSGKKKEKKEKNCGHSNRCKLLFWKKNGSFEIIGCINGDG